MSMQILWPFVFPFTCSCKASVNSRSQVCSNMDSVDALKCEMLIAFFTSVCLLGMFVGMIPQETWRFELFVTIFTDQFVSRMHLPVVRIHAHKQL